MSKERNSVIGIEIDELKDIIKIVVRNEIEKCLQENRFGTEFKDEIWDRRTVAEFFKVSPEKVTEMYNKKEIPGRKLGREYFFLKSQIIDLFKRKRA